MDNSCCLSPLCFCQILVRAVPIKEGHALRVAWPITPEIHHYKKGPCRYLSHLIGHEGEGSLYYILKTLGEICTICFLLHIMSFPADVICIGTLKPVFT